jgi:hypothetical protein
VSRCRLVPSYLILCQAEVVTQVEELTSIFRSVPISNFVANMCVQFIEYTLSQICQCKGQQGYHGCACQFMYVASNVSVIVIVNLEDMPIIF